MSKRDSLEYIKYQRETVIEGLVLKRGLESGCDVDGYLIDVDLQLSMESELEGKGFKQ